MVVSVIAKMNILQFKTGWIWLILEDLEISTVRLNEAMKSLVVHRETGSGLSFILKPLDLLIVCPQAAFTAGRALLGSSVIRHVGPDCLS